MTPTRQSCVTLLAVNLTSFFGCLIIVVLGDAGVLAQPSPAWVSYLGVASAVLAVASTVLLMAIDERQRRLDRAALGTRPMVLTAIHADGTPQVAQRAATGTLANSWTVAIDNGKLASAAGLHVRERQLLNAQGHGLSGCLRCADRWNWKQSHITMEAGTWRGAFPLCEECWQLLATPAARWPFYDALVCQWEADDCVPEPGARQRLWEALHAEAGILLAIPPMPGEGKR